VSACVTNRQRDKENDSERVRESDEGRERSTPKEVGGERERSARERNVKEEDSE